MKVYLASQYARRNELKQHREVLQMHGIEVTSRWLDEQEPLDGKLSNREDTWNQNTAAIDVEDVGRADILIFFSEDPTVGIPRGGRNFEMGYGWALGKDVYVLGPKENVFHWLPNVYHYEKLEDIIDAIVPVGV